MEPRLAEHPKAFAKRQTLSVLLITGCCKTASSEVTASWAHFFFSPLRLQHLVVASAFPCYCSCLLLLQMYTGGVCYCVRAWSFLLSLYKFDAKAFLESVWCKQRQPVAIATVFLQKQIGCIEMYPVYAFILPQTETSHAPRMRTLQFLMWTHLSVGRLPADKKVKTWQRKPTYIQIGNQHFFKSYSVVLSCTSTVQYQQSACP